MKSTKKLLLGFLIELVMVEDFSAGNVLLLIDF